MDNFVAEDFDYYKRTIEIMYQKYYNKRIIMVVAALVIIGAYTAFFQEFMLLNGLMILVLIGVLVFLMGQRGKFSEIYEEFLQANQPAAKIDQIEEDEYSYNILDDQGEKVSINKNGVRNLPSKNKQYTMMVGFEKTFFAKQPLQIIYYDMLDITYEEKFRLKRNGYNSMPRFLRRFSLGNIKASIGNLFSFIFGNIFILFIVFRLLRYIISMLRSFM
ncbi:hypothetical protein [Enterococcus pallens]|uniref:YcxB-like protein domain-containing protein n=1 Tax=Enterococcus pallens ATCC BAA-351 TaxID=1158607 RepID=R2QE13_9ENTE|nr:hypothetical protein [Enterococcus pallens]EOH94717.1 hypothetical protein UAU_01639 [Enterococcus pallens ATCC BAA-351]EOU14964.1 hypothetical protein I588_04614 [Enterococcus pallens ATCC BAA-351]OJG78223.1 hypothetical protein RV10_GL001711 [Enterococcus pallens]